MIWKPSKPKIEDCRVYNRYVDINTIDELITEFQDLLDQKVNMNFIKIERSGQGAVIWYDINEKETENEYKKSLANYERNLVEYKKELKKAYDEEFEK